MSLPDDMLDMKPMLLDLFCGAGGCSMGYHLSGFDVVGVDFHPQPRYPFLFLQADAMDVLKCIFQGGHFNCGGPGIEAKSQHYYLDDFAVIHASPPCQKYSSLAALHKTKKVDLIPETRSALAKSGKLWVIENVPPAKLDTATILCGSMFGLGAWCADGNFHQLRRHRAFESNIFMMVESCRHVGRPVGVYGSGSRGTRKGFNGFTGKASERREAMGIDWMNRYELSQATPPAYTEWIGKRLMEALK